MKYAIISDIHGNVGALSAVLKDAQGQGIDQYIFAGDYCSNLPYPNEVADTIRGMKNTVVVRGNGEDYMARLHGQDQAAWTDGQLQAHYWCYRAIGPVNREYLLALPKTIAFSDGGVNITVTHSSADVYGDTDHRAFSSTNVAEKYRGNAEFSRAGLLRDVHEYLAHDDIACPVVQSLPAGVYIFGHTHVQWCVQVSDKIFINSGSCGLPMDGTVAAPYTILTVENGEVRVCERRVPYDVDALLRDFKDTGLYEAAPVWSDIMLKELLTGYEYAQYFLRFVSQYAERIGDPVRPYSVETWTEAYGRWKQTVD